MVGYIALQPQVFFPPLKYVCFPLNTSATLIPGVRCLSYRVKGSARQTRVCRKNGLLRKRGRDLASRSLVKRSSKAVFMNRMNRLLAAL